MYEISDQELIQEIQKRLFEHQNAIEEQKKLMIKLQKLNKKLEESEALKSHFISNIRNEIINPFAAILGISQQIIALCNNKNDKDEDIKSMASSIYTEAFNLDFQLNNIFAAADIEAGEDVPDIADVNITTLISDISVYIKHKLEEKNLELDVINELPENFFFKTDASKLQLIIMNLLDNAISFSHQDRKIIMKITYSNELNFTIRDFGVGISECKKEHIFNRFNHLDSCKIGEHRGNGLGLCVTKALLDSINGSIDFESMEEKGSSFKIQIQEFDQSENSQNVALGGNEIFFDAEEKF